MTPENARQNPVVKDFKFQWEVIELKAKEKPKVSTITKEITTIRQTQSIRNYLAQARGLFMVLVLCVVREVKFKLLLLPQAIRKAHSVECSSAEGDLVNLALYDYSWFKLNNQKLHFALKEATRETSYST